ncbi:MAG: transposase [Myxococcales bacterium]
MTIGVVPGVGYLRAYSRARAVEDVLREACDRFGARIVHYTIQGMHLHLIVEADDAQALSRGMQGLSIRLAKRLNQLARRRGRVLVDRYHAHILKSRREVTNAVRYVMDNYRHHAREHLPRTFVDPLASARAPLAEPRTWLLTIGCRDG